jgi:hypothetical protein
MSQVENLYHINSTAAEIRDLWLATAREAGMAIPEPGSHEANVRRLRKLERACKRLFWRTEHGERYMPAQSLHGTNEREAIDAIGRLLEGEEAER